MLHVFCQSQDVLGLTEVLNTVVSSVSSEPELSVGIAGHVIRKTALCHALEVHAAMIEVDAFSRPATDIQVDADAIADAAEKVVNLPQIHSPGMPPMVQSGGLHGYRNFSMKAPQAGLRTTETNRVHVLSHALVLVRLMSALDDELELTRLMTAHQAVLEAFKSGGPSADPRQKCSTPGRKVSTPDHKRQLEGPIHCCSCIAGSRLRGESPDPVPFSAVVVGHSGAVSTGSGSSCGGLNGSGLYCTGPGSSGGVHPASNRRSMKVSDPVATVGGTAKKALMRPQRAPSLSGTSRMSDGRSSVGQSASGIARSSMFTFVPPAIELTDQYKQCGGWRQRLLSFTRPIALAETDSGLCDFAPDHDTWWCDALSSESVSVRELYGAWRLQRTLREALSIINAHNWCAVSSSLAILASALTDGPDGDVIAWTPMVEGLCAPPLHAAGTVAAHGMLRPAIAEHMRRLLPRVWLNASSLDVLQRAHLKRCFQEESAAFNRGMLSAADISRVAVQSRSLKFDLLEQYCSELAASLRPCRARVITAEQSALLSASAVSRRHDVFVLCHDPNESADNHTALSWKSSDMVKAIALSDSVKLFSMLSTRGEILALNHLPDPRYALRELRATELPNEVASNALMQQACALQHLSQLLRLLELKASISCIANDSAMSNAHQRSTKLLMTLASVRPETDSYVAKELRRIVSEAHQLLPNTSLNAFNANQANQAPLMNAQNLKGSETPLGLLTSHVNEMLLQLQITLYRTYRYVISHQLAADAQSSRATDATCLLHTLQHMHVHLQGAFPWVLCQSFARPSLSSQQITQALQPACDCGPADGSWQRGEYGHELVKFRRFVGDSLKACDSLALMTHEGCQQFQRAMSHAGAQLLLLSEAGMEQLRAEHSMLCINLHNASVGHQAYTTRGSGVQQCSRCIPSSPSHHTLQKCTFSNLIQILDDVEVVRTARAGFFVTCGWVFANAWDACLSLEKYVALVALEKVREHSDDEAVPVLYRYQTAPDYPQVEVLKMQLLLHRRQSFLEEMFCWRCPHHCPEINLLRNSICGHAPWTPLDVSMQNLALCRVLCVREEALRRITEKAKRLEQFAGMSMRIATYRLRTLRKPELSYEDAKTRHILAAVEEEEHARSQEEHGVVGRDVALYAVQQLVMNKAHGPCVVMSGPRCAVHDMLAARLFRCLMPVNTCLAREDNPDASSAPCKQKRWSLQLLLLRVISLLRCVPEAQRLRFKGHQESAERANGTELDKEDVSDSEDVELSPTEAEILQLVQAAFDGVSTTAGLEIALMRAVVLKAMVSVSSQGTLCLVTGRNPEMFEGLHPLNVCVKPEASTLLDNVLSLDSLQRLCSVESPSKLSSFCCMPRTLWAGNNIVSVRLRMLGVVAHAQKVCVELAPITSVNAMRIAVGASDFKIHQVDRLDHALRQHLDVLQRSTTMHGVKVRVHHEFAAEADYSCVKDQLVKGHLQEERLRLKGGVQQSCFTTKRDAMLVMVQSGALPISMKHGTLSAISDEEALMEAHDDSLQLKLLLGRVKTTFALHLLKRKRAHQARLQEAEECWIQEFPLINEMRIILQRHDVLRKKLLETQRMLTRYGNEFSLLEKRQARLNRAIAKMHMPGY